MRRTGLLTAVLALAVAACGPDVVPVAQLDWAAPVKPTPAPATQLPRLQVSGTALVHADTGKPLKLRGVNVCSLEFDRDGANWKLGADGSAVLRVLADRARWHANVVRIPVNQQWFLEDQAYVARVERLLDQANDLGLYVLLDVQWEVGRTLEPYSLNILERPTFGPGNTTEAFWLAASSRWANRTNVLYDLINEPHGHRDEASAQAMQVLVDAIRIRDQATVLVIGGPDWAHSVAYYGAHPLRGPHLLYSAHQYLPYDAADGFQARFVDASKSVAVIVGEFLSDAEHADYARALVDAVEHSEVNGWLPWAIGCGFDENADRGSEPFATLAQQMRTLNP
ncbi:MAG: glycoside hydrolase family 5 protein [Myxococcaceae bacterium]|nr:glycoside hydrolase family 5 protein [Myxococcaceae bacterium]